MQTKSNFLVRHRVEGVGILVKEHWSKVKVNYRCSCRYYELTPVKTHDKRRANGPDWHAMQGVWHATGDWSRGISEFAGCIVEIVKWDLGAER